MKIIKLVSGIAVLLVVAAFIDITKDQNVESELAVPEVSADLTVYTNQLGMAINHPKRIIFPANGSISYRVFANETDEVVQEGAIAGAISWSPSGNDTFQYVDLTNLNQQGKYLLELTNGTRFEFELSNDSFAQAHDAALKSFYINRSSTVILPEFAGQFQREAGHPDLSVTIHNSAASTEAPAGTKISSSKGWYDAGDFGKYVVNSGISTYTLLSSFAHNKTFYKNLDGRIPESNDDISDILNEAKWNLDWLYTMQAPDGGVYHKLTTLEWPGIEMPKDDKRERFVIGKTTSASLNFAATLAYASRVFSKELPELTISKQWLDAAESAWRWAKSHPKRYYVQPEDVKSGEYKDDDVRDEFSWAAMELYLTTGKVEYLDYFQNNPVPLAAPAWQNVSVLPLISIVNDSSDKVDEVLFEQVKQQLMNLADIYLQHQRDSVFAVSMVNSDFVWGSNSVVLNKAWVLAEAYKLSNKLVYRDAALGAIDYIFGQNPLGISYVTGFGGNSVKQPHHRTSAADAIEAPIPGMLAGGPQPGKQDKCDYQFSEPAKAFVDDWCSYASNEVAINWNAPLVYMLAFKINQL